MSLVHITISEFRYYDSNLGINIIETQSSQDKYKIYLQ